MTAVLKVLFAAATAAASLYSMRVFGPGLWSWGFLGLAVVVLVSLPVPRLDPLARDIGKVSGVLALLALGLLFLAGTAGGSFRVSESNANFAVLLAVMGVFGLSAFAWRNRPLERFEPDDVDDP